MSASTEAKERLQHAPRIDMRPKVTGAAKYIEDLPEPAGLLYGAVLTSPYSTQKLSPSIPAKQSDCPGVVGVLHRDHLGRFSSAAAAAAETSTSN